MSSCTRVPAGEEQPPQEEERPQEQPSQHEQLPLQEQQAPQQQPRWPHRSPRREAASEGSDSGDMQNGPNGKRPRLIWTPELHQRFLNAVNHLVSWEQSSIAPWPLVPSGA